MNCNHAGPEFGCESCIEKDHEAFDKACYAAWAATFKPPKCPGCDNPQKPWSSYRDGEGLWGEYSCNTLDSDGDFRCEDYDGIVKLDHVAEPPKLEAIEQEKLW
jgi:hypothetical protein